MKNQDKQYYIYLRSTRERVPCTKEEFENYYHDIDVFRIRQERHGRCVCPSGKRLDCDMDCLTCQFSRAGDSRSLDYLLSDEDESVSLIELIEDNKPLIEDSVLESIQLESLFNRLIELMPQAIEIGKLRLEGMSDRQISNVIGVNRQTFEYRINKVKETLKKEFSEFF